MRTPSRNMPSLETYEAISLGERLVLVVAFGVPLLAGLWFNLPLTIWLVTFVVGCHFFFSLRSKRDFRRVVDGREGEGICSFVRAFDYRQLDTWILRAVYEGLVDEVGLIDGKAFAIRPSDSLYRTLQLDEEDLEEALLPEMAARAGRDLRNEHLNPVYGKVTTVRDLVDFLHFQPPLQQ